MSRSGLKAHSILREKGPLRGLGVRVFAAKLEDVSWGPKTLIVQTGPLALLSSDLHVHTKAHKKMSKYMFGKL